MSENGSEGKTLLEIISDELYRDYDSVEVISEGENYFIALEDRVGKKYKVITDYEDKEVLLHENPKLRIFEDRGIKFGNYIELLLGYQSMIEYSAEGLEMDEFTIDNVNVVINHPSFLFDVAMNGFCHDKYYESGSYYTISLQGVTEDNYEEYLTKALFLIGYYDECTVDDSFPTCYEFLGEFYWKYAADEDKIEKRRLQSPSFVAKKFTNLKYYEALAFYNEAKRLHGHEIAFQYFYKVLEHFFLVCRQGEFVNLINSYNSNQDIDNFINSVTDIYKQNEESQLKVLLNSISSEISPIVHDCFTKGFISVENVDSFSEALYMYRNTIVHGKSDERFSVKIPGNVTDIKEHFWNMTAERIAVILIEKYCLE